MKRIVLFAVTNLAILAVLVLVASLLGLGGTLDARGFELDLPKLRDDTREILAKSYPGSLYLTGELGASRPWWKFWGNDVYRGVDTGKDDGKGGPKPWWQIW